MKYEFSWYSRIHLTLLVTAITVFLISGAQSQSSGQRVLVSARSYSPPCHFVTMSQQRSNKLMPFDPRTIFWFSKGTKLGGESTGANIGSFVDMKADAMQRARANAGEKAGRACNAELKRRQVIASFEDPINTLQRANVVDYSIDAVVCEQATWETYAKAFVTDHPDDPSYSTMKEQFQASQSGPNDLMCYAALRVTCEFPVPASRQSQEPGETDVPVEGSSDDIRQQIEAIRRGPHAAMPSAQASASGAARQTSLTFENGTDYALYVFLSGPTTQKVQIAAGQSQTVRIGAGNYEIAAKVSASSVKAFYGKQIFEHGAQYSERFFLSGP